MKTFKLEFVFEIGTNNESPDTINNVRKEICAKINDFIGINGVNATDIHYALITNDNDYCEYNGDYT